ncbi:MAG: hypothetical protein CMH49_09295 [Myxococcales bacterium]|nr:hypothetical protein [Myxococcales bacterium]
MFLRLTLSLITVFTSSACMEVLIVDDLFDASMPIDNDNYMSLQTGSNFDDTPAIPRDQTPDRDTELDQATRDMMVTDMMEIDPMNTDMVVNDMMIIDMMIVDQGIEEICNDEDDDLDGLIDENLLNACGQCPQDVTEELCDGQDNDCDQTVDEETVCPCPTLTGNDSIYLFCEDEVSWGTAYDFCAQHQFTLASIQSQQENQLLFDQMEAYDFNDTWIGLNDLSQEGAFEWSDQSPMNYTYWGNGEPNDGNNNGEDCGIILMRNRQSYWDDRSCNNEYSYICERSLVQP